MNIMAEDDKERTVAPESELVSIGPKASPFNNEIGQRPRLFDNHPDPGESLISDGDRDEQ